MGEKQYMIGKKALLGSVLVVMACLMISCTDNRMKNIYMEDGTHLRMNTADSYYIGFSQEVDDVILYPNKDYEMRIPYTIIDDDTAKSYIDELPFSERDNEKRYSALVEQRDQLYFYYCAPFVTEDESQTEYQYWIYIEFPVENENSFKYNMEIQDDVARNTLSGNLDLYEIQ